MVDRPLGNEIPVDAEDDKDYTMLQVPEGDIYYKYTPDDAPEKFDFLKAKYLFRFPFTITAIKWGAALGSFFALHAYIKKRRVSDSLYWFAWGSFMTGMPIWGFFMLKYSFYSTSIRKFEKEQIEQTQESFLAKDYFTKTFKLQKDTPDEKVIESVKQKQQEVYEKYSELDDIDEDPEIFADLHVNSTNKSEDSTLPDK